MNAPVTPPSSVDVAAWIRDRITHGTFLYQQECASPPDTSLESWSHFVGQQLWREFSNDRHGYQGCDHPNATSCALVRFVLEALADPSAAAVLRTVQRQARRGAAARKG